MEYLEIPCCEGPGLKIKVTNELYRNRSAYQEIAIYDTDCFGKCLFLDGIIQSSEKDHAEYDEAILRELKRTDKNLLILGGGDGHAAEMALRLNPGIQVTIVELDGAVVHACKTHLGQSILDHPSVNIVVDDAVHYIKQVGRANYDGIICDLTDHPIGCDDVEIKDFYLNMFSLFSNIVIRAGWFSTYTGCNVDIVDDIMNNIHHDLIKTELVSVASYGEACYFVSGQVPQLNY